MPEKLRYKAFKERMKNCKEEWTAADMAEYRLLKLKYQKHMYTVNNYGFCCLFLVGLAIAFLLFSIVTKIN